MCSTDVRSLIKSYITRIISQLLPLINWCSFFISEWHMLPPLLFLHIMCAYLISRGNTWMHAYQMQKNVQVINCLNCCSGGRFCTVLSCMFAIGKNGDFDSLQTGGNGMAEGQWMDAELAGVFLSIKYYTVFLYFCLFLWNCPFIFGIITPSTHPPFQSIRNIRMFISVKVR